MKKKKQKLLIVDFDKNLVNNLGKKIFPESCTTIEKFKQEGYKILLLTGRTQLLLDRTLKAVDQGCVNFDEIKIRSSILNDYLTFKKNTFIEECIKKDIECKVIDDNRDVLEIAKELGIEGFLIEKKEDWKKIKTPI